MKRHATDVVALSLGCAFLALVAVWALAKTSVIGLPGGGWLVAAALIVTGVAGIAAALRPKKS